MKQVMRVSTFEVQSSDGAARWLHSEGCSVSLVLACILSSAVKHAAREEVASRVEAGAAATCDIAYLHHPEAHTRCQKQDQQQSS